MPPNCATKSPGCTGTDVTLGVFHDGKTQDVKIKLGDVPSNLNQVANAAGPTFQLGSRSGTWQCQRFQGAQYDVSAKSGAVVLQVNPSSPAAQAGLRDGDVITQINGQKISDARDAEKNLAKSDLKTGVDCASTTTKAQNCFS